MEGREGTMSERVNDPAMEATEKFFSLIPPPDAKWFVEGSMKPILADCIRQAYAEREKATKKLIRHTGHLLLLDDVTEEIGDSLSTGYAKADIIVGARRALRELQKLMEATE